MIYVDLVGFQCCPAVTVEPVTEIIQRCSFTPVKGINTPLALQKSLAVLTCFIFYALLKLSNYSIWLIMSVDLTLWIKKICLLCWRFMFSRLI